MNQSTSSARTSGPRSLISVCSPDVGSIDREVGPRLPLDPGEVVEDRLLGERSRMRDPVAAARQPGGDHGAAEQLQGARHVDALASREGARLDRAMAVPKPEVRDRDGAVDRGIQGDGEDHLAPACPGWPWWRRRWASASTMPITIATAAPPAAIQTTARGPGTASSTRDTSDGLAGARAARLLDERGASGHLAVHGDDGGSRGGARAGSVPRRCAGPRLATRTDWPCRAVTCTERAATRGSESSRPRTAAVREPLPLLHGRFPAVEREPVAEQSKRVIVAGRARLPLPSPPRAV